MKSGLASNLPMPQPIAQRRKGLEQAEGKGESGRPGKGKARASRTICAARFTPPACLPVFLFTCLPEIVTMSALELKIPPPLVAAAVAGCMYGAAALLPHTVLALPPAMRLGAALALAAAGACLDLAGLVSFRKARTTVNPLNPQSSSAVVTTGVYRFTRNPMYLGMALILLGWTLYLASPWGLLGPLVFAAYITRFQIVPEERALQARFGAAFTAYRARVRRWL